MAHAQLGFDDLILSHHTIRHASFTQRVEAAANAGYCGIGVSGPDIGRIVAGGTPLSELAAVLRHFDQTVLELEAIHGWSASGDTGQQSRQAEQAFYDMNAALGPAHHLQAIGSYEGDLDHAAECFAALCDRAAEHGLPVALEFIPEFTNIGDVATAAAIVERADRPNGGLCVDIWHYTRGPSDASQLLALPAERIVAVQVDDGPLVRQLDDYLTDTMTYRQVPGAGQFDLAGFLKTLTDMGVRQPISLEVISVELDQLPPAHAAALVAEGMRAVLQAQSLT